MRHPDVQFLQDILAQSNANGSLTEVRRLVSMHDSVAKFSQGGCPCDGARQLSPC